MLYVPNWNRPGVFNIESLIAWLEKQPPSRTYTFTNALDCLAGQYLRESGEEICALYHHQLVTLGWLRIVEPHPRTFGAALERARACTK